MPKQPKKRGRGRPPVPKGERRDIHLPAVRVTADEFAAIEAAAAGLDLSEHIRRSLLKKRRGKSG